MTKNLERLISTLEQMQEYLKGQLAEVKATHPRTQKDLDDAAWYMALSDTIGDALNPVLHDRAEADAMRNVIAANADGLFFEAFNKALDRYKETAR